MSISSNARVNAALVNLTDRAEPEARTSTVSKAAFYAEAEQRMRNGKRLVFGGFVVAVVGIVSYCAACFSGGVSQDTGAFFLENPGTLVVPTLGVIGLGTLLWLVGSFVYLNGAMDSDPDSPEL